MQPEVTVILPIHNGKRYIDRCFDSIFRQSYKQLKVICIDDGSTDGSIEKIEDWRKKFKASQFKVLVNQNNLGITKSLNKALDEVDTELIARIDVDDVWSVDKIEKQVEVFVSKPKVGMVGCNYIDIGLNGKRFNKILPENNNEIKKRIIWSNPLAHSCVLFKKELIEKVGKYDENIKYGQDYDLWLRMVPYTNFYNVQEYLCQRIIGEGLSAKKQKEQMLNGIKIRLKYIRKYNLPVSSYLSLIEPLVVLITPEFIRDAKRRWL